MDTPIANNYIEMAKSGNPSAISVLINKALGPKGITATVKMSAGNLDILLTSKTELEKEAANFIRKGVAKLDVESVYAIRVRARVTGQKSTVWSQTFELKERVTTQVVIKNC